MRATLASSARMKTKNSKLIRPRNGWSMDHPRRQLVATMGLNEKRRIAFHAPTVLTPGHACHARFERAYENQEFKTHTTKKRLEHGPSPAPTRCYDGSEREKKDSIPCSNRLDTWSCVPRSLRARV